MNPHEPINALLDTILEIREELAKNPAKQSTIWWAERIEELRTCLRRILIFALDEPPVRKPGRRG